MTKLEELIKEFCPNGVEYKKIGETLKIERGVRVVKSQLTTQGIYPVYQNSLTPMGYYDKFNYSAGTAFIIGAGSAGEIGYSNIDFWAADDCYCLICNENINSRYLYHCLLNNSGYITSKVRKASIPRLSRGVIESLQIPLPALPVQREIVRILDSFTLYSAELTAELTARRKQYEFYRDKLLNFGNFVEERKLEECCNILDNKRKPIAQSARVAGTYPYYGANGIQDYVAEYLFDGEFILVGEDGSVITENGNPIITWAVGKIWVNNHAHIIQSNGKVNFRFLFHYLHIIDIKKLVHGNIPKLTGKDFKELQIPVPPMDVQERIVKVLDNFDAICSDLGIGLPAEIEKRQKQYEYYREKLLTFDGKYATILTERNGTERNGQG